MILRIFGWPGKNTKKPKKEQEFSKNTMYTKNCQVISAKKKKR